VTSAFRFGLLTTGAVLSAWGVVASCINPGASERVVLAGAHSSRTPINADVAAISTLAPERQTRSLHAAASIAHRVRSEQPRCSQEIVNGSSMTTAHLALLYPGPDCTKDRDATTQLRGEFLRQSAAGAESLLIEGYLSGRLQSASDGQLDAVSVQCRASMCEVVLTGYDSTATQRWQDQLDGMHSQPWARAVRGEHTALSVQGTQQTLITYLLLD
jgi:hypothetical protein